MMSQRISVIGGDLRQISAAKRLAEQGYDVKVYGFSSDHLDGFSEFSGSSDFSQATEEADCVLLPLPVSKDGAMLNTPLWENCLPLEDLFSKIPKETAVFCGMSGKLPACYRDCVIDYAKEEDFLLKNAYLTAEAAVGIAICETPISFLHASVLITGYGRIGSFLAKMLKNLGAITYVAARRDTHFAKMEAEGHIPVSYESLPAILPKMELIFNTVPTLIFDDSLIGEVSKESLFVDLASLPGGIDFTSAKARGLKVIHALSLPGKIAPVSSGKIVADTVIRLLSKKSQ